MIHTDKRKLCLAEWLKRKNTAVYLSPLKLQKFLFLYEAFSKIAGESYDFSHLKGYIRGPVFSNVWGDYTKDRDEFEAAMSQCAKGVDINKLRAQKAAFITSVLTETELSELTHKLDIWQTQKERIMSGEQQVSLLDSDFSGADTKFLTQLYNMYDEKLIEDSVLIPVDKKNFVLSKADACKLTEQQMDTLEALSQHSELHNPVFVSIDEEGALLID